MECFIYLRSDFNDPVNVFFYILSTDKIKKGDWCLPINSTSNPVLFTGDQDDVGLLKIVSTTNKSIIENGNVQLLFNSFVKDYVANFYKDIIIKRVFVEFDDNKKIVSYTYNVTKTIYDE